MSNYTYALQSGIGMGIIPTVNAPYKYTLRKIAAGNTNSPSPLARSWSWIKDNFSLYTPPRYEDPRGWTYAMGKRAGDGVKHMGFYDPSHTAPTPVTNLVDQGRRQNASTRKTVVPAQQTAHVRQSSATLNDRPTSATSTPVRASTDSQQGTEANPSANPSANQPSQTTTTSTKTTPNAQQRPYGMFNRFRDIWNMLVDRITLWWYQSGMKSGKLTPDQWKSVQNAAKRLGNNRTARDFGQWWNPDKYNSDFFGGLHSFTQNLQRFHNLSGMLSDMPSNASDIGAYVRKKMSDSNFRSQLMDIYKNHGKMRESLQWGVKHGYIPKDQLDKYNTSINMYDKINAGVNEGKKLISTFIPGFGR